MTATSNREAWLAARRQCITATDMAAILGVHPYRTPREVYLEKLGETEEKRENEAMFWGNRLEALVGERWSELNKKPVTPGEFVLMDGEPTFGATPDFLVGDDAVLEVKTAGFNAGQNFGSSGSDDVPVQYLVQVMHQLMVTGRKTGYLAVLIGGQDYRQFTISRRDAVIDRMKFTGRKFWAEYVQKAIEPPITGHPADTELLKGKYPNSTEEVTMATEEVDEAAAELGNLLNESRDLETKIERLRNVIREHMGECAVCKTTSGNFTWRTYTRRSINWQAIAAATNIPSELIAENTSETSYRTFKTPFKSDRA